LATTQGGGTNNKTKTKTTYIHMKKLLTLLAAVFCAAQVQAGEFPDISIAELKSAIAEKKVTVIDVNGSDSFKAGHIPGAIDFTASKAEIAKALPSDKGALVVAYCAGPQCGAYAAAAKKAQALGYTNVKHLSAGISGWKEAGAPLEK
jgi:rhodanese-related sulfurtransferase